MKILYLLLLILISSGTQISQAHHHINTNENALVECKSIGIAKNNAKIKLHLGCGTRHINGYINIDFPPEQHTTQQIVAADIFADVLQLKFPSNSIQEIRSHHLFEHFDRPTALALLCKWHEWLEINGILTIETPDLEACVHILSSKNYTYQQKQITMRHLFGSHEASWAYHYDGWYAEKFLHTLSLIGFEITEVKQISNPGYELIPNIQIKARKKIDHSLEEYASFATSLLKESLVNNKETKMLKSWQDSFNRAITKMQLNQ